MYKFLCKISWSAFVLRYVNEGAGFVCLYPGFSVFISKNARLEIYIFFW